MLLPSGKMRFELNGCVVFNCSYALHALGASSKPAHARANEGIDETQLEKIAKAERGLALDWAELALPDCV